MGRLKLTPEAAYRLAQALRQAGVPVDSRLETAFVGKLTPWGAMNLAQEMRKFGVLDPWLEEAIAEEPMLAYRYARDIRRATFPEAEAYIALVPHLAAGYLLEVIEPYGTHEDEIRFRKAAGL